MAKVFCFHTHVSVCKSQPFLLGVGVNGVFPKPAVTPAALSFHVPPWTPNHDFLYLILWLVGLWVALYLQCIRTPKTMATSNSDLSWLTLIDRESKQTTEPCAGYRQWGTSSRLSTRTFRLSILEPGFSLSNAGVLLFLAWATTSLIHLCLTHAFSRLAVETTSQTSHCGKMTPKKLEAQFCFGSILNN